MSGSIPAALLQRAAACSTATLHEAAGRSGALPSCLRPLSPRLGVCGPALPVRCAPGDNLRLHHAIVAAAPGDVLVVDTGGGLEFGYWGEVMAIAAMQRGIAGLVIHGGVRDSERMVELGFPVFSARVCIQGTIKQPHAAGSIGEDITLGTSTVRHGDLVRGDADGVCVLPAHDVARVVSLSEQRDAAEQDIFARLRAGASTLEIYALPQVTP